MLELIAERLNKPNDAPQRLTARREREFLERAGADPEILDKLSFAVEPKCFGFAERNGQQNAYLNVRYAAFVPTRSELEELLNKKIGGYWPDSQPEAERLLQRVPGVTEASVVYGWPTSMPSDLAAAKRDLPTCTSPDQP